MARSDQKPIGRLEAKELKQFKNLRTLRIWQPKHCFNQEGLEELFAGEPIPSLQKIILADDSKLLFFNNPNYQINFFPALTSIEYVAGTKSLQLNENSLKNLLTKQPNINDVCIKSEFYKNSKGVIIDALNGFKLKKLTLDNIKIDEEEYRKIGNFQDLEELSVCYPSDQNADEIIKNLIKALPKLKKITILDNYDQSIDLNAKNQMFQNFIKSKY